VVRFQIESVFVNLIANSIEAMPAGGRVRIEIRKAGNSALLIEPEDTGLGVPTRIRRRPFEPFVTAGKKNGMGLGLASCRRIVRDHGGSKWLEPGTCARLGFASLSRTNDRVCR
jgi:signal transduction histidine kinase